MTPRTKEHAMADASQKQGRREFVLEQLRRVQRDEHDPRSVEGCLAAIGPVLEQVQSGEMLREQVDKLVRAGNSERAIKLVEVAPFRSKHAMTVIALLVGLVGVAVAIAAFVASKG
jgi:hypothetical protein